MSGGHLLCADRSGAKNEKSGNTLLQQMNGLCGLIEMLLILTRKEQIKMTVIYAEYNMYHNSIDVATTAGYLLRIDCGKAEEGLKTTPGSEYALNALAIDEPLEYAKLYLEGNMQMWVDAEDSLEIW